MTPSPSFSKKTVKPHIENTSKNNHGTSNTTGIFSSMNILNEN